MIDLLNILIDGLETRPLLRYLQEKLKEYVN